jgi:hypothetical protein
MKVRRQRGATLGLVAACVFLVIIVGVGFFFLSKIIGGGREVANATDAGALNVAKHAIRRGAVPLSKHGLLDEFGELTEPKNSNVDLVTYNRLVAQALIVGRNAEVENTPTAKGNANFLAGQVRAVGAELKANLEAAGALDSDFTSIASQNNTKMWNGPAVGLDGAITAGYMKKGSSTNVYFSPATLAAMGGFSSLPLSKQSAKAEPGSKYISGYDPINVFGSAFVMGVPVLPQTKPHLVDHGQFVSTAPDPNVPPNSFRTNSRALEAKSGNIGGSVACAIVGTINKEFSAVIPRGFVRIMNGNDATINNGAPTGVPVSNGANDIFNNELFAPPGNGVYQANTSGGGNPVFSTNGGALSTAQGKWAAYAATLGKFPKGTLDSEGNANNTTDESSPNYGAGDPVIWRDNNLADYLNNPATYNLRSTAAVGHYADFADLIAMGKSSGMTNCVYTMYDDSLSLTSPCVTGLGDWSDNFGRNITMGGSGQQPGGFTNVEFMKADLLGKIAGRKGGKFCATVAAPGVSGVKAWPQDAFGNVLKSGAPGSGVPYVGGGTYVNYLNVDTPMTYLKQLAAKGGAGGSSCDSTMIVAELTKRMQQVNPAITTADVESALSDKKYPLTLAGTGGGKLYMYVENNKPRLNTSLPWKDSSVAADGPTPSGASKCDSQYPLNGWAVNTAKGMTAGAGHGDGGYHEMPFTSPGSGSGPRGTDSALWHASSGYNNLLGELKFEQVTEGATFCKPN